MELHGETYQARFDALAAQGFDVHGEVDLVVSFGPRRVLDAGCGTGRVAIELANRGVEAIGVDSNASMLAEARNREPTLAWIEADLATMDLGCTFDVVVLAGNVPLFCPVGSRASLVRNCASHVVRGGILLAGFQIDGGYTLEEWDGAAEEAGLQLEERWSTWARDPFEAGAGYAVSVHRRSLEEA